MQHDLEVRLEKRLGAMMEHLVEPAVQEAVLNLYISKLKPQLTTDKWMPGGVRRAMHEACDELWQVVFYPSCSC